MFDFRYHVASLVAVFLALVIGILVGVGIADRGVREESLRLQIQRLGGELSQEQERSALLARQQQATQDFVKDSYGALMAGRLDGRRVATLFVGSADGGIAGNVQRTVSDAGGRVVGMRALKVPVDGRSLISALAARSLAGSYGGEDGLSELGHDLATELVDGEDTPLWDALGTQLIEEQEGSLNRPADGIVIARTSAPQKGATGQLLSGFYDGLGDSGVPVVGVENSGTTTTAIGIYRRHGLSSVDDLDTATGRLAVALLLAGGEEGQYGLRESADGLMPPIEPLDPVD